MFLIYPFCLQWHKLSNLFVLLSLPTYVLCMYFQTGFQHSKNSDFASKGIWNVTTFASKMISAIQVPRPRIWLASVWCRFQHQKTFEKYRGKVNRPTDFLTFNMEAPATYNRYNNELLQILISSTLSGQNNNIQIHCTDQTK